MTAPVRPRLWLLGSLCGTLAILAWVPTNMGKLVALLGLWGLTFRPRPSHSELITFGVVNALFFVLNGLALQGGAFRFETQDVWGMPLWELVMWGYYVCWSRRVVAAPRPTSEPRQVLLLTVVIAIPFTLPLSDGVRLAASVPTLLAGLHRYHDRYDVAMLAVMITLGATVEQLGVRCGLWHYTSAPLLGVPLWFVTMWGSVGLLARRLVPVLEEIVFARERAT